MTGNKNFSNRLLGGEAAASETESDYLGAFKTAEELIQALKDGLIAPAAYAVAAEGVSVASEKSAEIARAFEACVSRGDAWGVLVFVREGLNVNERLPDSNLTPLQLAAGLNARDVVRVLVESDACDYTIRDRKGRLASELAFTHGRSVSLARLLSIKERKQAEAQGIKLTRRP